MKLVNPHFKSLAPRTSNLQEAGPTVSSTCIPTLFEKSKGNTDRKQSKLSPGAGLVEALGTLSSLLLGASQMPTVHSRTAEEGNRLSFLSLFSQIHSRRYRIGLSGTHQKTPLSRFLQPRGLKTF